MQVSAALLKLPGISLASVVMATELNREVLAEAGLLVEEALAAGPNDLVVAVRAEDAGAADRALAEAENLLARRQQAASASSGSGELEPPRSLRSAVQRTGASANLAFVSVPGPYAAAEARQALLQGLHVFLFSDNVSVEDEVQLKSLGRERDLLVMGPDCGTAILNGVGLGFANRVRCGRFGVIGASGTGMQELTTLLHRAGEGVSQAIGTGGRDLSDAVGGSTMLQALELLRDDPQTEVLVLVSKPPSPRVAEQVLSAAAATGKPVVACLLGAEGLNTPAGVQLASNLADAARLALGGAATTQAHASPSGQGAQNGEVRGLYCGGTLCDEAMLVLGEGHTFIDFGDDEYTRGRAHPMIDPTLRNRAILEAAADPGVAVILFDVILGYGAHANPAGELVPVLREAQARAGGRPLRFLAHIVGTDEDPQGLQAQEDALRGAGVELFDSNYEAALAAREAVR